MKIIFISNKPYPEFEVYDENRMVVHIKIDPQTKSFRITVRDNRRVFLIEDEVIKKIEITTLLNEYSQQLGSLTKSKSDINAGEIEIEGVQYNYKLDNSLTEIDLYAHNSFRSILHSKLERGPLPSENKDHIHYLLFALAWFTFLTKEQADVARYAESYN